MKRKEKSKKTITGHMQNRSVTDYIFTSGGSLLPYNKVYSKITTVSF
jgi:hypothetical protein